jgi:hypothetical protein
MSIEALTQIARLMAQATPDITGDTTAETWGGMASLWLILALIATVGAIFYFMMQRNGHTRRQ